MKTSVLSNNGMSADSISGRQQESLFSILRNALRTAINKLDQMGSAIALGEAVDLDGAHALREKHAK